MLYIRHGLSEHNVTHTGVLDVGNPRLHPIGHAQVLETAQKTVELGGVDVVVVSESERAIQSAVPIAHAVGAVLVVHEGLNEFYWGTDAGRHKHDVFTPAVQALADAEGDEGWDFRLNSEAETRREVALRVIGAIQDIEAEFPERTIAAVGSSFSTKCAVAYHQGIEASDARRLGFGNGEILAYDYTSMPEPRSVFVPRARLF